MNGVSIIICCYNSEKLLPETLKHISMQKVDNDLRWEVIIVNNNKEALIKWESRLSRIKSDNMIVKFCDRDLCTPELISEFDSLALLNKVCFTAKQYPNCKTVIFMKEFENENEVNLEWNYSYRYYNFVKKANKILKDNKLAAKLHQ
jgi:uncharacterized protein (DUF1919 family)